MHDSHAIESSLSRALIDAKIRGVSHKERSFIRCELLYQLVRAQGLVLRSEQDADVDDVNVLVELELLGRLPGRPRVSRHEIYKAIEEYKNWESLK